MIFGTIETEVETEPEIETELELDQLSLHVYD